jgi:hypothetical protein
MYKECIVAFIDILGFKELVNQSINNEEIYKKIYETLSKFKKLENHCSWQKDIIEVEEDAQKKNLKEFELKDKIKCTCFSDSILITVEVNNNINEIFSTLIANLSRIGSELLCEGIIIRGGIDISKIYHENNIIFGMGLINSYELEANIANYPRIVLSKDLISKLNYPLNNKKNRFPYHQYLKRFDDGCVGLHQLIFYQVHDNTPCIKTGDEIKEKLKKSKKTIIRGLDSNFTTPQIFLKYKWLKIQYDELIINENLKEKIHDISEPDSSSNIHYEYINKLFD